MIVRFFMQDNTADMGCLQSLATAILSVTAIKTIEGMTLSHTLNTCF